MFPRNCDCHALSAHTKYRSLLKTSGSIRGICCSLSLYRVVRENLAEKVQEGTWLSFTPEVTHSSLLLGFSPYLIPLGKVCFRPSPVAWALRRVGNSAFRFWQQSFLETMILSDEEHTGKLTPFPWIAQCRTGAATVFLWALYFPKSFQLLLALECRQHTLEAHGLLQVNLFNQDGSGGPLLGLWWLAARGKKWDLSKRAVMINGLTYLVRWILSFFFLNFESLHQHS